MVEADSEGVEFEWGKKRGIDGKKKDMQIYESFTYDGVEYLLYDSVYMYKEDETEPYIGKLIKIWETSDRRKKVKVIWFFRPSEIANFLGDEEVLENELFLASGQGAGLANINPLETIAGKCNVLCISKDSRNVQPSDEELQKADYIFRRTFDVEHRKIMDEIDDQIAGTDVKSIFNGTCHKVLLRSKVESGNSKVEVGRLVRQFEIEEKAKCVKDYVKLDDRPSKKARLDGSVKVTDDKSKNSIQKLILNSDGNDTKALAPTASVADISKLKPSKYNFLDNGPFKKLKPDDKATMVSNQKLPRASATHSQSPDHKMDGQELEVTRRPNADRSRWFTGVTGPWEDRLQTAHEQGRLVLLQNLDPVYTSAEVEDIVWHGFEETCNAKMIQRTAFSSPHSGQAFVIFKTRQAAEMVVKKLEKSCLLLSNGRPLLGRIGTPCFAEKKPNFCGHLVIDKLRLQMTRDMKDAKSTSHFAQPNTIEYDMAIEWCVLQETSKLKWKELYKQQGHELREVMTKLKPKRH